MTNKLNNNEKGFALPLTLLLLVVMTIMGATLITVITGEHKANTDKDTNQQVFYAAESGIAIAKKWMATETPTLESASQTAKDGSLKFCKTTLFPNLKDNSNSLHSGTNTLSNVITGASREEKERLGKYSFEYTGNKKAISRLGQGLASPSPLSKAVTGSPKTKDCPSFPLSS